MVFGENFELVRESEELNKIVGNLLLGCDEASIHIDDEDYSWLIDRLLYTYKEYCSYYKDTRVQGFELYKVVGWLPYICCERFDLSLAQREFLFTRSIAIVVETQALRGNVADKAIFRKLRTVAINGSYNDPKKEPVSIGKNGFYMSLKMFSSLPILSDSIESNKAASNTNKMDESDTTDDSSDRVTLRKQLKEAFLPYFRSTADGADKELKKQSENLGNKAVGVAIKIFKTHVNDFLKKYDFKNQSLENGSNERVEENTQLDVVKDDPKSITSDTRKKAVEEDDLEKDEI